MAGVAQERQDVHKSCRAIEALVGVLNDYCEAASALASTQKRLSKTLKDAAALKTNPQVANAFGATLSILEVLADVDSKFAKIAEKESRAVSSEVKKWFKKLAKDEKAHDERMNDSNARIKQAGQAYEKKSKKGTKDAGEEHARYIQLLSVIGPEMSQQKYNHAVNVTHQNALVTFNVAATLSRIADAEWARTCECVRRISPAIGPLGEWRSLCEGAWTGPLPDDLPDISSEGTTAVSEWGQNGLSTPVRRSLPVPPVSSHSPGSVSVSAASSLDPPRSPFSTASQNQGSVNSITTLSAFPFPPTHFPLPLATNEAELQRQQTQLQNLQSARSRAGSPNQALAPALTDSPKQIGAIDLPESAKLSASRSPPSSQTASAPFQPLPDALATEPSPVTLSPEDKGTIKPIAPPGNRRRLSLVARVPPPSDKPTTPLSPFKRAEHSSADKEFGVQPDGSNSAFKSHSADGAKKSLERADSTQSAGGNVAALRSKYSRVVETPQQAPKDILRLPLSVPEIASRYQPTDEPTSPRHMTSPVADRFPPDAPHDFPIDEHEIRRRKQRLEELIELQLKEKECELRQREHELNQRTRDLERDRLQFLNSRTEPSNAGTDGPKGPRTSAFQHKRGSQSVTHVNLSSSTTSSSGVSAPGATRPSTSHLPMSPKDHAPYCGCDTCSVAKYKQSDVSPSPRDLRPPEPPILLRPEKPKGWIRRLSMPSVNVALSLDAKKNTSALSLKAGLPLPAENGRLRKRSFEQGVSNRTMTGIGRP